MGRRLNYSFKIGEWGGSDAIKGLPIQVRWSKQWSEEGRRVAEALSQAKFVEHSGGRWPQEDIADELADNIAEKERIPEHIQMMFDEGQAGKHHHDHHHHHHHSHGGHDHHHGHGHADDMDAYGLGNAWGH